MTPTDSAHQNYNSVTLPQKIDSLYHLLSEALSQSVGLLDHDCTHFDDGHGVLSFWDNDQNVLMVSVGKDQRVHYVFPTTVSGYGDYATSLMSLEDTVTAAQEIMTTYGMVYPKSSAAPISPQMRLAP